MIKAFKNDIEDKLSSEKQKKVKIPNSNFKWALEETGRDLVYNYFIFKRSVSYETFLKSFIIHLKLEES